MNDSRIRVVELSHTGNIGFVRNMGAHAGTGSWIAFLDSDDLWVANKLEIQIKALQQSNGECCYGNFELMDETGYTIPVKSGRFRPLSGNIIRQVITTEAAISTGALMLSRKIFDKIGGFSTDPRLMGRDDYELVLRLALCTEMISVPDVLLRIREHAGRGTNSVAGADAHEYTAVAYEIFISGNPGKELEKLALEQYGRHMTAAAKNNFRRGKYGLAFQQLKKSFFRSRNYFKKKQPSHFAKIDHEELIFKNT
jgi:glycosyltransferase involved in cell wall biosynthesis